MLRGLGKRRGEYPKRSVEAVYRRIPRDCAILQLYIHSYSMTVKRCPSGLRALNGIGETGPNARSMG
jgi:hypothetical protein